MLPLSIIPAEVEGADIDFTQKHYVICIYSVHVAATQSLCSKRPVDTLKTAAATGGLLGGTWVVFQGRIVDACLCYQEQSS